MNSQQQTHAQIFPFPQQQRPLSLLPSSLSSAAVNNNNNRISQFNSNNYKHKMDRMFSISIKRALLNEAVIFAIDTFNCITLATLCVVFSRLKDDQNIIRQLVGLPLFIFFSLICSTMLFVTKIRNANQKQIMEICQYLGHCNDQYVDIDIRAASTINNNVSEIYYCYQQNHIITSYQHPDPCICSCNLHWLALKIANEISLTNGLLFIMRLISNLSLLGFGTYMVYILLNYELSFIIVVDMIVFVVVVWLVHGVVLVFFVWNLIRGIYKLVKFICPCLFKQSPLIIPVRIQAQIQPIQHKRLITKQKISSTIKNKNIAQQLIQCTICLDPLKNGTKVASLKCSDKHKFHEVCIQSWKRVNSTCPACRKSIIIKKVTIN